MHKNQNNKRQEPKKPIKIVKTNLSVILYLIILGGIIWMLFGSEPAVTVLFLDKNLGFAGGNNAGYAFLKEKYDPDFIICANNDIIFTDSNFLDSIEQSFVDYGFDVMGPDIVDADGQKHLNPLRPGAVTESSVRKDLHDIRLPYMIYRTALFIPLWERYKTFKDRKKTSNLPDHTAVNFDCTLQGSCLIFSKKFICSHGKAFCSYTFLYFEEYILKTVVDSQHGLMIYDPRLSIVHLGGRSTSRMHRPGRKKTLFLMGQYIQSWKAWLKVYDQLQQGIDPLL